MLSTRAKPAGAPSAFFQSHFEAHRPRRPRTGGLVLDLACGLGRHALAAAEAGCCVMAADRNAESLAALSRTPIAGTGSIETLLIDLETPAGPPEHARLTPGRFDAVFVFRYLHRPLMPWIEGLLAPGGLLLYETFTTQQKLLGWGPRRDAFLLRPRELPSLFTQLDILDFEEGLSADPQPAQTARLAARRRVQSIEHGASA